MHAAAADAAAAAAATAAATARNWANDSTFIFYSTWVTMHAAAAAVTAAAGRNVNHWLGY